MIRSNGIIIFLFFISNALWASAPLSLIAPSTILPITEVHFLPTYLRATSLFQNSLPTTPTKALPINAYFQPSNPNGDNQYCAWSYEELAFFCKIEVQLEKAAKIPIKFRLGEVQQVERMEGKY